MLNKEKKYLSLAKIWERKWGKERNEQSNFSIEEAGGGIQGWSKSGWTRVFRITNNRGILANLYDKNVIDQEGIPI